jgi:hypothetical protein
LKGERPQARDKHEGKKRVSSPDEIPDATEVTAQFSLGSTIEKRVMDENRNGIITPDL